MIFKSYIKQPELAFLRFATCYITKAVLPVREQRKTVKITDIPSLTFGFLIQRHKMSQFLLTLNKSLIFSLFVRFLCLLGILTSICDGNIGKQPHIIFILADDLVSKI